MAFARFGWLGSTQQAAVHAVLLDETEAWAREWCWSPRQGIAAASAPSVRGTRTDLAWSTPGGSLAWSLGASSLAALGAVLAGTAADDEDDLALSLGRAAIEQLTHRIYRRAGLPTPSEPGGSEALPATLGEARLGAFRATFVLATLDLQACLTRGLCDRLAPPPAGDAVRPPLASRIDAMATTRVALSAVLDLGDVALAALADLRAGEVLVSDVDLHAPVTLQVAGQGGIATARLHKQRDRRAVVLEASLQPTS